MIFLEAEVEAGEFCAEEEEEVDFDKERWRLCAREVAGSWMPSEGSESDLRRVLYGIVGDSDRERGDGNGNGSDSDRGE